MQACIKESRVHSGFLLEDNIDLPSHSSGYYRCSCSKRLISASTNTYECANSNLSTHKIVIPDCLVISIYCADVKFVQSETRIKFGFRSALSIAFISFLSWLIKWNGLGLSFLGLSGVIFELAPVTFPLCVEAHQLTGYKLPRINRPEEFL